METAKTDNHNLAAKLELRRRLLREFPQPSGFSVCDCFSGGESLWKKLRTEFPVAEYLALDVKAKRARLKLDSLRYLENQKWTHNVVDLDAYGSPWRHFFQVLKRGLGGLVFLTVGNTMFRQQQRPALAACGLTFPIPGGLQGALAEIVCVHCLAEPLRHSFTISAAYEAENPGGSARYFGLHLVKHDTTKESKR